MAAACIMRDASLADRASYVHNVRIAVPHQFDGRERVRPTKIEPPSRGQCDGNSLCSIAMVSSATGKIRPEPRTESP